LFLESAAVKVQDLRPGWRTDLILHAHGAQVTEHEDCIAVRTPANPNFYWGNCLLLPAAPADADLPHWHARFEAEIARHQPQSLHRAFGINAAPAGEALPSWEADDFERILTSVLEQLPGALQAPARRPRGSVEFRPLDLAFELELAVQLQCADTNGFEPAGYQAHRRQQMRRYAAMAQQGLARWFGLWCDGTLAADCGLMRGVAGPGAVGRFQHVSTHAQWRRRGLCTALVHAVTAWGFEHWQLERTVMCADPEDVAIGIYEALGYGRVDSEWGLQRRAPQDRRAAAGGTA
jgi:RimJ/RimL family protein N-acetyltransferase